MRQVLARAHPWADLGMNLNRARHWHPLNRSLWVGARVTLGGHLLQAKGDRVAMHSSVEVRYPFLDESVFDFTAKLHPRWKLRGLRDKHLHDAGQHVACAVVQVAQVFDLSRVEYR